MPGYVSVKSSPKKKWLCCINSSDKKEIITLLKIAWPLMIVFVAEVFIAPISMIFAGHLGTDELAGVALAASTINILGLSVGLGLSSACDTFFSQTWGSGNKKYMGVHLQRSTILVILSCFPICALMLNAQSILLVLGQKPIVAKLAAEYCDVFLIGFPINFCYQILTKYLQNMNIIIPLVFISICGTITAVLGNFVFVNVLEWGVSGCAMGSVCAHSGLLLATIIYIAGAKVYKDTWYGWSSECLLDWGPFMKLAIAGLFMITFEWMAFEAGTIFSGLLGEVQLSSMSILFQVDSMSYCLFLGISVAVSVRVGQALGEGNIKLAKKLTKIGGVISTIFALFVSVTILAIRIYIPMLYTTDPAVISSVASGLLILAGYVFLDGITNVHAGILRGTGRQHIGAIAIFVSYYLIGSSIGIPLLLFTDLEIEGYWIGIVLGDFIACTIYVVSVYKTNWKKEAELARTRSGLDDIESSEDQEEEEIFIKSYGGIDEKSNSESESRNSCNETDPLLSPRRKDTDASTSSSLASNSITKSKKVTAKLVLLRLLTILVVMSTLVGGFFIRLFAPLPYSEDNLPPDLDNSTEVLPTMYDMYSSSAY